MPNGAHTAPEQPTDPGLLRVAGPLSPALAGLLSFVLPGLGQLAAGARRRGLLTAIPAIVLILALAATWVFDRRLLFRIGLSVELLLVVVVLSLVLLAYRAWAIVDAYLIARRAGPRRRGAAAEVTSLAILVAALGVTVFMHGWVAYVGFSARETLIAVFGDAPNGIANATASPSPTEAESPQTGTPMPTLVATPPPTPSPTPVPDWAADGRLNVLLIGSDAGPGRWSMRADAIILVSVEIESGRVAAFSVPRYTRGVPLPEPAASAFECGCLMDDYFNALYVYANQHPTLFPGDDEASRGLGALSGAAEQLFGVTLDGMAVADLNGFVDLVDAMGGVTINVPEPLYDAEYPEPDGSGTLELFIPAGPQHMDGWHALAFARTRHQDGDVNRMKRQQITIKALQREIQCNLLGKLPAVLDVARESLWTSLPLEDVPEMLEIHPGPVEGHVLFDTYNVTLSAADVERVRTAVAQAFDGPAPSDDPELDC